MKIIDDLISSLREDSVVREVHTCILWTAVVSKHCGLASTFREEHPRHGRVRAAVLLKERSLCQIQ
ncbi:enolase N-terminal-like fold-containing protein [Chloroflexota bacterium]